MAGKRCKAAILAGTGCCAILIGIAMICVGHVVFAGFVHDLKRNVLDAQHIDNTDDESKVMTGDGVANRVKYQEWARSPAQVRADCLALDDFTENDCPLGATVGYIMHNITNVDEVMKGGKLEVQELAPIWFAAAKQNVNADLRKWNNEGVAVFDELYNFSLHHDRCAPDSACARRLEETIVTINPLWIGVASSGAEAVVYFAMMGMLCMPFDEVTCVGTVSQLFQLGASAAKSFVTHIVMSPPLDSQARAGEFMMQASSGQDCALGADVLAAADCGRVLDIAMSQVIPHMILPGIRQVYGGSYGGTNGSGQPLFIKVRVKEYLGFKGASFTEPMMQLPGLSMFLAADKAMPAQQQVHSKSGEHGVMYSVGMDCGKDVDCGTAFLPGVCSVSDVCVPSPQTGISSKVPARAWGAGTTAFAQAGKETAMFSAFTQLRMPLVSEAPRKTKIDGTELEVVPWKWLKLERRLENCNGTVGDSVGIDCDGPPNTAFAPMVAHPGSPPLPLYVSGDRFGTDSFADVVGMNAGQAFVPYRATDRVEINTCVGDAFCDPSRRGFALETEPETGAIIRTRTTAQMNFRVGKIPSPFNDIRDALVPFATLVLMFEPSEQLQVSLGQMQSAPAMLENIRLLLIVSGGVLSTIGLVLNICAVLVSRLRPKANGAVMEVSAGPTILSSVANAKPRV